MMLKMEKTGGKPMQIVVLDAKTLKVEELDLSPWRALGVLSLYDRTDPMLVPQRLRGADVVLTNKVRLSGEQLSAAPTVKRIASSRNVGTPSTALFITMNELPQMIAAVKSARRPQSPLRSISPP